MRYRRVRIPGGVYFFTLVTFDRQRTLCLPENLALLRQAFRTVIEKHPFTIEAIVILPDHLHCIWRLPTDDDNYPTRWRLIKSYYSHRYKMAGSDRLSPSRVLKKEQAIWQRRYWEHYLRDENDFKRHLDYIHFNPVKHGLVKAPFDWEFSSFKKFVRAGIYSAEWGSSHEIKFFPEIGME